MSDQRTIARELVRASERGESIVLASIVRTAGATYRGVGARMLVRADGTTLGLLSGGCLEGDLVQRAMRVSETGEAEVASYDGRADDDLIWGLGAGCNGLVEILLERRCANDARALGALIAGALDHSGASVMATVVRASGAGAPEAGARVLVRGAAEVSCDGNWGHGAILGAVIADAQSAQVSARRGMNLDYAFAGDLEGSLDTATSVQVAFELFVPTVDLVICGSGPDAIPVARLAASLGWSVTVVDPRPVSFTPPERFGGARIVECAHSEDLGDVVAPTARTAAIVMSHNYERDLDYLDALARTNAAYIGVLGPRARTELMMRILEQRGRPFPDAVIERLYAPIGLDLGGEGADGIALSIIAEISAVMHDRRGSHLRESAAAIHAVGAIG